MTYLSISVDVMSRLALALILSTIILASTSSFALSSEYTEYGFKLEISGTAHDRNDAEYDVELVLSGDGYGWPSMWMWLRVTDGTVTVAGMTFDVVGGQGLLIQETRNYIHLSIRIIRPYGGQVIGQYLRGETDPLMYDNVVTVKTLSSRFIILPTPPRLMILYDLMLKDGTLAFDE